MRNQKMKLSDWMNVPEDISQYVGFVYCITYVPENKRYIGKKLFWSAIRRKPLKGNKRIRKDKVESDWVGYWGSCKELLEDKKKFGEENFIREILSCHKTRWEWSYAELKEQVNRDVLIDKDYYNGIIRVRLPAYGKTQ